LTRGTLRAGADEIDHRADVLDGGLAAHDRRIALGVLRHLFRADRFAVAAQVEQVDVVAARRDVIHPRHVAELEIEGGRGRVGGAVHVQHRAFRPERRHVRRTLVAHVDLDAGVRRHHHLFHDDPR